MLEEVFECIRAGVLFVTCRTSRTPIWPVAASKLPLRKEKREVGIRERGYALENELQGVIVCSKVHMYSMRGWVITKGGSLPQQLLLNFSFSLFPPPSSLVSPVSAAWLSIVVTTAASSYQRNRIGVALGTGLACW